MFFGINKWCLQFSLVGISGFPTPDASWMEDPEAGSFYAVQLWQTQPGW